MPAIQPAMLVALKSKLRNEYVPYLPPLLGDAAPANKPEKQIARALSSFALHALFDADPRTAGRTVVDDYNDNGVDAVYYHQEEKTLYFVQAKLKATEQFKLGEAQSFLSGVKLLIDKQYDQFNENVQNLSADIDKALDECDQIKLLITYTGDAISVGASNEIHRVIQAEIDDGEEQLQLEYEVFGPSEIEDFLRKQQSIKLVNDKIRIHKYRICRATRHTVFGLVKVEDLLKLHDKYDKGLYEKNIRYFIGSGRRGVNSAIKETLLNEPHHFLHLNNGITMVGTSIKQKSKSRDNKTTRNFEVVGMSVVNGAQTIATAAQFVKENPDADISQAQVMLTLINTGSDSFHKQVTKARNLQNPVDLSNFAALDDNQERLRQEMALYGVEYHYRPQRQIFRNTKTIGIDELAKALACFSSDIRYASRLKSEPGLFTNTASSEYKSLFTTDINGQAAINLVNVYQTIEQLLSAAERSSPSPERLVYRHCGYAISSILMKQLKNRIIGDVTMTPDDIKVLISVPFDDLRQEFSNQYQIAGAGSAHHAFFKRITDTANLVQKVMIANQNLALDQNVQNLQARLDYKDPYNQALTSYLIGKLQQI